MKVSGLEQLKESEQKFIQFQCRGAKINFDRFGYVLPVIIAGDLKKPELKVFGMSFQNQDEKVACLKSVRDHIIEKDVHVVMTTLESYYLSNKDAAEFMKNPNKWKTIKEHPKSKEAVMFSFESRYTTLTATADIVSDGSDKKTILEAKFQPAKMQGIFSDFLKMKLLPKNEV